jgi:hypothetical protein
LNHRCPLQLGPTRRCPDLPIVARAPAAGQGGTPPSLGPRLSRGTTPSTRPHLRAPGLKWAPSTPCTPLLPRPHSFVFPHRPREHTLLFPLGLSSSAGDHPAAALAAFPELVAATFHLFCELHRTTPIYLTGPHYTHPPL